MSVPNPELREPTTAEKLATYDAGMRERARIAGAPILRAHTFWGQSAPLGENTLIFTAPKGQLTVSDFEGTYVRPVTNRDVAMIGGVVDSDAKYTTGLCVTNRPLPPWWWRSSKRPVAPATRLTGRGGEWSGCGTSRVPCTS